MSEFERRLAKIRAAQKQALMDNAAARAGFRDELELEEERGRRGEYWGDIDPELIVDVAPIPVRRLLSPPQLSAHNEGPEQETEIEEKYLPEHQPATITYLPRKIPKYIHPLVVIPVVLALGASAVGIGRVLESRSKSSAQSGEGQFKPQGNWPYSDQPWPDKRTSPQQLEKVLASIPKEEHSVFGPPTIDAQLVYDVLNEYDSPVFKDDHNKPLSEIEKMKQAQMWIDKGFWWREDPAYTLAFFVHESSAGTNPGWAGLKTDGRTTHNIGNIICAGYSTCYGRFRDYSSWDVGLDDLSSLWWEYGLGKIDGAQRATVESIIPKFAPASDNNDEANYIATVNSLVDKFRQRTNARKTSYLASNIVFDRSQEAAFLSRTGRRYASEADRRRENTRAMGKRRRV